MSRRYTISQLAHAAEVPTTTVRYYERVGLVRPEDRSAGNYRLYSDESLQKLKFIRTAQAIGFTLDDVKALLSTPDSSAASCRQVQSLIEERLAEVAQRLKDLRHVQQVLKLALAKCRETERDDCCHVIETLRESSEAK
jgi:MerR family mercuric resistance operon transcriptional regulator